jgi:predicted  nucleic acid-binding Zn-ribbon protein
MTKAQQTYERIEALITGGASRAEAFQQLAKEYGQPLHSIRSAYYVGRKQANGEVGSTRRRAPRKRETTEADAVERAITALEDSIADIRREVESSAERAQEAQAEHEAITAASGPRIEAIQAKVAVLRDAGGTD